MKTVHHAFTHDSKLGSLFVCATAKPRWPKSLSAQAPTQRAPTYSHHQFWAVSQTELFGVLLCTRCQLVGSPGFVPQPELLELTGHPHWHPHDMSSLQPAGPRQAPLNRIKRCPPLKQTHSSRNRSFAASQGNGAQWLPLKLCCHMAQLTHQTPRCQASPLWRNLNPRVHTTF